MARATHAQSEQNNRYKTASVVAGISQFDFSGTGTALLIGARAAAGLNRRFLLEGSLSAMRLHEQFGQRQTYLIPEAQLQVQAPFATVRPYIGLGGGLVHRSGEGHNSNTGTVTSAGGVRVLPPSSKVTVEGELRVRALGSNFNASSAEWTLGLGWPF